VIENLPRDLVARYEHTLLAPVITNQSLAKHCKEALGGGCYGVCVPSSRVADAYSFLEETNLKVICVVDVPFGASDGDVKRFETEVAVDSGAHEIDVVMNLGRFRDKEYNAVLRELRDVVESAEERPVKVIIEAGLLDSEEVRDACQLVLDSGARFVATSAGLGPSVNTPELVRIIREIVGPKFGIKASALNDFSAAREFIDAGAYRFSVESTGATSIKA
jgi:deoxyribose-phosphate aldolase